MTADAVDLAHLRPAAQQVAVLPNAERVHRIRADRWIGYPRAVDALGRLENLLTWPDRQRMPNLLLLGPTNNGKSTIVEKFRRLHPPISHPDHEDIPVLVVQMPSEPSVIRFTVALLAAMGAPLRPRQRLAETVRMWMAEHAEQIELHFLPGYSPELNPVELFNGDLKHHVASRTNPADKHELAAEARTHLRRRQNQPEAVRARFGKEEVRYAAA